MSSAIEGVTATTRLMYSRQAYAEAPAPVVRAPVQPERASAPASLAPESPDLRDIQTAVSGRRTEMARELQDNLENARPDLDAVVESTNNDLQLQNRSLRFRVNPEIDDVQIQVVDTERGRVIRSIPAEDMIAMASRMRELFGVGAMVDQSR